MPKTVKCPHCGAQNPYSLLVTICQQCKGDLEGAEPIEAPIEGETVQAAPPETLATTAAQVVPDQAAAARGAEPGAPSAVTHELALEESGARSGAEVVEQPQPPARHDVRVPITEVERPPVVPGAEPGRPPGEAVAPPGFRSCARCGHRQDARRASCERCGMHFVGPDLQATVALTRQPLRRAPKSSGEQITQGCGVIGGCLFAIALAFVIGAFIALGTMR